MEDYRLIETKGANYESLEGNCYRALNISQNKIPPSTKKYMKQI